VLAWQAVHHVGDVRFDLQRAAERRDGAQQLEAQSIRRRRLGFVERDRQRAVEGVARGWPILLLGDAQVGPAAEREAWRLERDAQRGFGDGLSSQVEVGEHFLKIFSALVTRNVGAAQNRYTQRLAERFARCAAAPGRGITPARNRLPVPWRLAARARRLDGLGVERLGLTGGHRGHQGRWSGPAKDEQSR